MRLRTLTLWKKLKPLWLGIFFWACISVAIMVIWGYSMMDFRGGLSKVEVASSQIVQPEKNNPIKTIDICAEGVKVEIGASYDIKNVQIQLYGEGYVNQKASWNLSDAGDLTIRLDAYPVIGNAYGNRYTDTLVLRILLPKKSYDAITVHGKRLNTAVYQCNAKQLSVEATYGDIVLNHTNVQRATLCSETSDITIERSRIQYLETNTGSGDTYLLDNELRYWNYKSLSGTVEAFTDRINGIWDLSSDCGNIHIGTRKWGRNLLLQLSSKSGTVVASSKETPWDEIIPESLEQHKLILLEGRGENMLCVESNSGNVLVDTVRYAR